MLNNTDIGMHSQAGAWERKKVTSKKLNLMAATFQVAMHTITQDNTHTAPLPLKVSAREKGTTNMKTLLKISLVTMIATSSLLASSQWIDPSHENCTSNGGKLGKDGVCEATWDNATAICASLGAKLPTIEQLKKEVENCGGVVDDWFKNNKDPAYQSCYKNKGFILGSTSIYYLASTTVANMTSLVWGVSFYYGDDDWNNKTDFNYVRCVRAGQ